MNKKLSIISILLFTVLLCCVVLGMMGTSHAVDVNDTELQNQSHDDIYNTVRLIKENKQLKKENKILDSKCCEYEQQNRKLDEEHKSFVHNAYIHAWYTNKEEVKSALLAEGINISLVCNAVEIEKRINQSNIEKEQLRDYNNILSDKYFLLFNKTKNLTKTLEQYKKECNVLKLLNNISNNKIKELQSEIEFLKLENNRLKGGFYS